MDRDLEWRDEAAWTMLGHSKYKGTTFRLLMDLGWAYGPGEA